jgi:hypothetical protein
MASLPRFQMQANPRPALAVSHLVMRPISKNGGMPEGVTVALPCRRVTE